MALIISPKLIVDARRAKAYPIDIDIVEQTGSTNADLLQRIAFLTRPTLLLALSQTGGRGRNGRAWHSAPGASLTFSLAWKFSLAPHELTGLPLAVGIAIARTLGKFDVRVQLKWPNDILKDGKKLAGVLIETAHSAQGSTHETWTVIGIGINLTLPDSLEEMIGQPAADMPWLAQADRNILMAALLDELTSVFDLFSEGGLTPFIPAWNSLHAFAGQEVILIDGEHGARHGIAAGIDHTGRLLMDTAAGRIAVNSGNVSLRALSGYPYAIVD